MSGFMSMLENIVPQLIVKYTGKSVEEVEAFAKDFVTVFDQLKAWIQEELPVLQQDIEDLKARVEALDNHTGASVASAAERTEHLPEPTGSSNPASVTQTGTQTAEHL